MSDALKIGGAATEPGLATAPGLPGKNADVKAAPVIEQGKTFSDISTHASRSAIEALAARGVINGMDADAFAPDKTMTRAEFAAIVVRSLGLTPKAGGGFGDVPADRWFAPFVGTAHTYGIVSGVGNDRYEPQGTLTRQEAAAMVARAAKLCGMTAPTDDVAIRDILAQFADYTQVDDWARESMALCYDSGILDRSDLDIQPKTAIRRGEIAQMLFNMLEKANLL
jgi:hypothetical protein